MIEHFGLTQMTFSNKSEAFGHFDTGLIFGHATQFDSVQVQVVESKFDHGSSRSSNQTFALMRGANQVPQSDLFVVMLKTVQAYCAAKLVLEKNVNFKQLERLCLFHAVRHVFSCSLERIDLGHCGQVLAKAVVVADDQIGKGLRVFWLGGSKLELRINFRINDHG